MKPEDMIRRYFQAWIDNDSSVLDQIFSEDIVYSECYGPEYRGLRQIKRWFADWNQRGRVLQWNIKQILQTGSVVVAEWYFQCDYDGNVDGFDGVTIAELDDGAKIRSLKEFQSKAEHHFPYHEL